MRDVKKLWFQTKVTESELSRFNGKIVLNRIRDMQCRRRGLVLVRSPVVKDENGNPCTSLQEQQQRWRRYFEGVLNNQSQFDAEELEKVKQRSLRPEIARLLSQEEIEEAVGKLKNAEAGWSSNILPEMVKAACSESGFSGYPP